MNEHPWDATTQSIVSTRKSSKFEFLLSSIIINPWVNYITVIEPVEIGKCCKCNIFSGSLLRALTSREPQPSLIIEDKTQIIKCQKWGLMQKISDY